MVLAYQLEERQVHPKWKDQDAQEGGGELGFSKN
jgi:hypothetical protein